MTFNIENALRLAYGKGFVLHAENKASTIIISIISTNTFKSELYELSK